MTESDVLKALAEISTSTGLRNLVAEDAVRHVEIDGSTIRLLVTIADPAETDSLRAEIKRALRTLPGVTETVVTVQALGGGLGTETSSEPSWSRYISGVRNVVAVASGKGGVGKSTVAANLALALARKGRKVGLLDADIYGPSQQLMMGAEDDPVGDAGGKIRPVEAPGGVKVMSFGFIIDADQPVIWRGPMLMKALEQFFGDVLWGELDDLVVDLPPGTGDVALTLCQNVPVAGAVIVTTPQDVALIDARKSLNMFRRLGVEVLGIIENMAHYQCAECGHIEHVFGSGGGRRTAESLGIPYLGAIPLDPVIVSGGDTGKPVVIHRPETAAALAFSALATSVVERLG